MAQTKSQIQDILARANTAPRHRFGQNFMIDGNLVRLIADAGEVGPGDLVIEVGPGTGTLTEELLTRAGQVVAVEIDRDLAASLRDRYADRANFQLIEGDALDGKHALNAQLVDVLRQRLRQRQSNVGAEGATKLVANLPYNIASPLVIELLMLGVDTLVFTVQKEVADRLNGKAGTNDFGPLTAMVQLLADVEVIRTLPNTVFWPPPKIQSALVRLRRNDRLGVEARGFSRFVSALFSLRRKTLRKALDVSGYVIDPVVIAGRENARAEDFTPTDLLALFRARTGSPTEAPPH
jgi:16S rRNA (adenine1518-N6/adenine1519-N6)-dimethyltransferase